MKLTKEKALKLHREMWGDMQKELGDNPCEQDRSDFKYDWLVGHDYVNKWGEPDILDNCFLCEFAIGKWRSFTTIRCEYCPIDWSELTNPSSDLYGFCIDVDNVGYEVWQNAPISKILALPERDEIK